MKGRRRTVYTTPATEAALAWLGERGDDSASSLLREAATARLAAHRMRVWMGDRGPEVVNIEEYARRDEEAFERRLI